MDTAGSLQTKVGSALDAFVSKFNASGSALNHSTNLVGSRGVGGPRQYQGAWYFSNIARARDCT